MWWLIAYAAVTALFVLVVLVLKHSEDVIHALNDPVLSKCSDTLMSWCDPHPLKEATVFYKDTPWAEAPFLFLPFAMIFPFTVLGDCLRVCVHRIRYCRYYLWNGKALREAWAKDYLCQCDRPSSDASKPWNELELLTPLQFWSRGFCALLALLAWPLVLVLGYAWVVPALLWAVIGYRVSLTLQRLKYRVRAWWNGDTEDR